MRSIEVHEVHIPRRARLLAKTASRMALYAAERFFKRLIKRGVDPEEHVKTIRSASGHYALYIHMPFCHRPLCTFCCFVRYPFHEKRHREYIDALLQEISWLASTAEGAHIETLYIGGGTPSIDVYSLARVIDAVREAFGGKVQVSTEANPRDLTDEAVSVLRSAGVSRLSIGVQALEQKRLLELGRLNNTVEDVYRAVDLVKGKFETVNIDIIWGIRSDTPAVVAREAARALSLPVDQVTFYPLMPAPGLRELEKKRREGPWHPLEHRLYGVILGEALSRGFRPATPWCMDRGSRLIDEYVVDYDKFLALGISGIGRVGSYVYVNTFSLEKYSRLVRERGFPTVIGSMVSTNSDMLYYSFTAAFGLRWPPPRIDLYGLRGYLLASTGSAVLKLLGERRGSNKITQPGSLYLLHSIQRSIYMAVNMLREYGMQVQI
ncbi:radical SAM protein [Hyperthermus butylicus]|uniref:Oxygen-independent coproporphyrinogen III oxidase n=1 Tax=Hyperthermus butylicus (strain DSM 5456 / JCM 9403 / PLM1-5) TaxID=415426 RepID=A2BJQ9_HYPBU|nr:radical SAM protein [Hyperthermus butylicus]ABM80220.1 Oxygen-independent coproporphyrinogen III oxidase [Hyperthermus butylicus DSM 5456]